MQSSPSKRLQRPPRLNSVAFDNSVLLDSKQLQNGPGHGFIAQKRSTIQRQHHRRQMSMPDATLLKSAITQKMLGEPFGGVMDGGNAMGGNNNMMMNANLNIFTVTEQQSPVPAPYNHMGNQPSFYQFPPRTAHQHHGHARKGSIDSMQALRRGSLLNPSSLRPLAPASRTSEMLAHDIFGNRQDSMGHTGGSMMSISPFDLAPLPHPNFVNLSSLAMGSPESDMDDGSFYSHSPVSMSPGFPPHDIQQHLAMYDHSLQTADLTASPVIQPQQQRRSSMLAQAATVIPLDEESMEQIDPLAPLPSGITMEEINSYIAGPESCDGKWVCMYEGCAKRFGRKENIKSHVQTHLGDRQFRCSVCKKCFVRQHDLKRHSKIHTGVKPYPCLCGNSFARHDALTRHRQRGMCIGAFEGVVRKEVKRGRPRKRPLEGAAGGSEGGSETSKSASGNQENNSVSPTPSGSVRSASTSPEAESPDGSRTEDYTPPTSPSACEVDFNSADKAFMLNANFLATAPSSTTASTISSSSSTSLSYQQSLQDGLTSHHEHNINNNHHHHHHHHHPHDHMHVDHNPFDRKFDNFAAGLFSDEDILSLSQLERDPSILNFGDDGFGGVKEELNGSGEVMWNALG